MAEMTPEKAAEIERMTKSLVEGIQQREQRGRTRMEERRQKEAERLENQARIDRNLQMQEPVEDTEPEIIRPHAIRTADNVRESMVNSVYNVGHGHHRVHEGTTKRRTETAAMHRVDRGLLRNPQSGEMANPSFNKKEVEQIEGELPQWFKKYQRDFAGSGIDPLQEIKDVSEMPLARLNLHLRGSIKDLPYEVLQTLFINGADNPEVADILRNKRVGYLKDHPEEQVARGASEGIITFDGRFIPKSLWETATDSEKRTALVGSTCFHVTTGTPGMDSNPEDRF